MTAGWDIPAQYSHLFLSWIFIINVIYSSGNLHVQVPFQDGSSSALLSVFTVPRHQWVRLVFTFNRNNVSATDSLYSIKLRHMVLTMYQHIDKGWRTRLFLLSRIIAVPLTRPIFIAFVRWLPIKIGMKYYVSDHITVVCPFNRVFSQNTHRFHLYHTIFIANIMPAWYIPGKVVR